MMNIRRIGRRFPDYGWSWPTGSLDQLLKAALLPDEEAARLCAAGWLDQNDIDHVSFREHRLLTAISDRFGRKLTGHAAYPRLVGLQKMLWTKSRMAMREAEPALKAMVDTGCMVMLIKGASRIALDAAAQRGRVAHDIDILVRPRDMQPAFDVLRDRDWQIATGVSPQYLRTRLASLRSMNFFKGNYGDIDLHQLAYDGSQQSAEDDLAIWRRATAAEFSGVGVVVPSPADRIALAIAHGGLDAHTHSDWLVDCTVAIQGDGKAAPDGNVDWSIFLDVIARRGLAVAAAVALSYLALEIGIAVPEAVLAKVVDMADRRGAARLSSVLQAKPRTDFGALTWLSRGFAKQLRLQRKKGRLKQTEPDIVWRGKAVAAKAIPVSSPPTLSQAIAGPQGGTGQMMMDVIVRIAVPPVRRRIEMEINSGDRHVARLRSMVLSRAGGERMLRFRGKVRLGKAEQALVLEARPSRQFRNWDNERTVATYGALPFQLVSATFSPAE
ncbi:nucleotidyltransferase family protein [Mesorhizobium sp. MSK_1335]|uniref:Nucleotidyltransferase family protein n=1 Tax=Mesorhizobium montanum TaxID=3072323 RepID=A0ABU4ZP74_9HYPH|nr:nucleotidyltransferase family protein [Mesorhizobium sp. MSK_1335]MDX8527183.1 nucleotidyltransferase family protein [Mesorhizobium sp. MSK_1335]